MATINLNPSYSGQLQGPFIADSNIFESVPNLKNQKIFQIGVSAPKDTKIEIRQANGKEISVLVSRNGYFELYTSKEEDNRQITSLAFKKDTDGTVFVTYLYHADEMNTSIDLSTD